MHFVSFVSATTYYLLILMDENFFRQGTGNRILWILDGEKKLLDEDVELAKADFFWGIKREAEFKAEQEDIVNKLLVIRDLPLGAVELEAGASIDLDRYRVRKYNQAVALNIEDNLDTESSIVVRLAQNAMKLALIHCQGRYAVGQGEFIDVLGQQRMEINEVDVAWAIGKTDRHFEHYLKMHDLSKGFVDTTTRSYKNDWERVLWIIDKVETKGKRLTANVLRQHTGWSKEDCGKRLDEMQSMGYIKFENTLARGKKVTYWTKEEKDFGDR